jgi:O-antigen/teichoic acid export membrane protein
MFVVISSALSVLLIPHYGAQGAAISLMIGCIVSCLAFALMGRMYYRMPIDLGGLFAIPGLAAAFVLGVWQIGPTFAPAGVLLFLEASIFVVIGIVLVHRLGLLQAAPGQR